MNNNEFENKIYELIEEAQNYALVTDERSGVYFRNIITPIINENFKLQEENEQLKENYKDLEDRFDKYMQSLSKYARFDSNILIAKDKEIEELQKQNRQLDAALAASFIKNEWQSKIDIDNQTDKILNIDIKMEIKEQIVSKGE